MAQDLFHYDKMVESALRAGDPRRAQAASAMTG